MLEEIPNIKPEKKDSNLLGAVAYGGSLVISFIAPLAIYLLAKEDRFAKFHALNSLGLSVAVFAIFIVLSPILLFGSFAGMMLGSLVGVMTGGVCAPFAAIIPSCLGCLGFPLVMLVFLGLIFLLLYCTYLAYQGKAFRIPYVTDFILKFV